MAASKLSVIESPEDRRKKSVARVLADAGIENFVRVLVIGGRADGSATGLGSDTMDFVSKLGAVEMLEADFIRTIKDE